MTAQQPLIITGGGGNSSGSGAGSRSINMALSVGSIIVSLITLGLVIFLFYYIYKKGKQWYDNPRSMPVFLLKIYNYFKPRGYSVASGLGVTSDKNAKIISKLKKTPAANCATSCSETANCVGFVEETDTNLCQQFSSLKGPLAESPIFSNVNIYIADGYSEDTLDYGFVRYSGETYKSNQPMVIINDVKRDSFQCLNDCGVDSNCAAISIYNETGNCVTESTTKYKTLDSNVVSYQRTSGFLDRFSPADFSST